MRYPRRSHSRSLNSNSTSKSRMVNENEDVVAVEMCNAWLGKHPSALDCFEEIVRCAEGKDVVVFLDYDGTLSPIVSHPDQALMSHSMRSVVKEVANCFPTAIISGRSRDKVYEFVRLGNLYYAGSHGLDISTPLASLKYGDYNNQTKTIDDKGKEVVHFHPALPFLPTIQEIIEILKKKISHIRGSIVEDNKFCVSVHFRLVNEENVEILKELIDSTMEAYPNFSIAEGKKVWEIRPRIDWDKGRALRYLLDTLGFDTLANVLPFYIGDDRTDEDAFKMIKGMGQGFGIVVASSPKETKASYSLYDTNEVMSFLKRLAEWKRDTEERHALKTILILNFSVTWENSNTMGN